MFVLCDDVSLSGNDLGAEGSEPANEYVFSVVCGDGDAFSFRCVKLLSLVAHGLRGLCPSWLPCKSISYIMWSMSNCGFHLHVLRVFLCVSRASESSRTDPGKGCSALVIALRTYPGVLQHLTGLDLRVVDADLPLELKGTDNAAILGYYRDLLSEPSVVSLRCRVMLLGNGGAGKTALAQRVVTGIATPPGSTTTTHGVLQRASKQPPLDHASFVSCQSSITA